MRFLTNMGKLWYNVGVFSRRGQMDVDVMAACAYGEQ